MSAANKLIQYASLHVFANDRTIDAQELAMLERMALRDGEIDEDERRVLSRIFAKVNANTVTPAVWDEITAFKEEHAIP